jgi:hypothetical protein
LLEVKISQPFNRLRRDHWRIPGENNDVVICDENFVRYHEGVPGASLLGLQHEVDAGALHGRTYSLRLVADNRVHVLRGNDSHGGPNHMLQQRLAPNFM